MTIRGYLFEAPVAHEHADRFATQLIYGMQQGHEELTSRAAAAVGISGRDLQALITGTVAPDVGARAQLRGILSRLNLLVSFPEAVWSVAHVNTPGDQWRHALRRTAGTSTGAALAEIRAGMRRLYDQAISAFASDSSNPSRNRAFRRVGEALHLLQDSYSEAHTERLYGKGPGGSDPIRYVRYYHFDTLDGKAPGISWGNILRHPINSLLYNGTKGPREHMAYKDDRDEIKWRGGALKFEATRAIDASTAYLRLIQRHFANPAAPSNAAEFNDFLNQWLRGV